MAEIPKSLMEDYENRIKPRIERLKQQVDESGIVTIPFTCYGCDLLKTDFVMVNGDGCPMCAQCINRMIDAIEGVPLAT